MLVLSFLAHLGGCAGFPGGFAGLLGGCAAPDPDPSVESPRLLRLTHKQWENTVVDLLGLTEPTGLSDNFVPDPAVSTFENDAGQFLVSPVLWQQYQSAAETLAERVVTEPDIYAAVVPQDLRPDGPTPGADERDAWIAEFGARAFRRPLDADELEGFRTLFAQGAGIFASGDAFVDGVHACVAAFLQSPGFLYRSEGARSPAEATYLPPDDFAAKLSYALWNTMPDEELADAAEQDGLSPGTLDAEVQRMLDDHRGHEMVADLHRQLLHIDSYAQIYRPDQVVFDIGTYASSVPASMQVEAYSFVDHVIYGGGTLQDLLTSPRSWIDDNLAPIYGIRPFIGAAGLRRGGRGMRPVTLDPNERAGILTLSGFLAWEADQTTPNLIERGAFINSALLCVDLPPPPASATPLPTNDEGLTERERIDEHTSECGAGCHTDLINPIGYAFGNYDEDGKYVVAENGHPIDATGEYTFDDGTYTFDGAVDLAWLLSEREQVHRCYVGHLMGYLQGRPPDEGDEKQLERLTTASMGGEPIRDIITDIVTDPAFRRMRP
jgi:hypothetical protein